MSFQLNVYTIHQWMREVLHCKISCVQTEKLQWEFQLSLSARKRALKRTKNQPVYSSQKKRLLAVDLCKITEMRSLPKVPAFGLFKYCLAGTRQGSRQMRVSLKADVKGRMPCSDGIAVI